MTSAYLSYESFKVQALRTSKKSLLLAKAYYREAAYKAGYTTADKIGAIRKDNTEMDDYQRQFELYKKVANKLGKNIRLMVSEDDVRLYNRMQEISKLGI